MKVQPLHYKFVPAIKSYLPYAGIIILGLIGCRDLFLPGFYESHDGILHVMRVVHLREAILSGGGFPIRWLSTWMAGYGSPVFNYIWPLPYFLAVFLTLMGLSAETGVEILLGAGYIISGYTSYIFLSKLTKSKSAAFLGSAVYLWAPYRFTDLYIRGAIGEGFSFVFFPVAFWAILKAKESKKKIFPPWLAIFWALFILTHNLMALVAVIVFMFNIVYLSFWEKLPRRFLFSGILALVLGVGISSWYVLPAFGESNFVGVHEYLKYSYVQNFVPLALLIYSTWRYAYAASHLPELTMSFQFGFLQWVILFFGIAIGTIWFLRRKWERLRDLIFFGLLTVISLFLVTNYSKTLYRLLPYLYVLNYPWRFLETATFGVAVISALLFSRLSHPLVKWLIGAVSVFLLLFLNLSFARIVSYPYHASDKEYLEMVTTNTGFLPDTEFLPKGIEFYKLYKTEGKVDTNYFQIVAGPGNLVYQVKKGNAFFGEITATDHLRVRLKQFAFPGWQVRLNGHRTDFSTDDYGLIEFEVLPGRVKLEAYPGTTPLEASAVWISIFSFLGLGIWQLTTHIKSHVKN